MLRPLAVITLAVVAAVACSGSDGVADDTSASADTRRAADPPVNVFDPATARVGDTVVGLVIDEIRPERASTGDWVGSARFRGEVHLDGRTFAHPDGADYPYPCFEADTTSALRLPRWKGDDRRPWFCFENAADASAALGTTPGRVHSILIERFTIHRNLSDAVNSARFLGKPGAGLTPSVDCFRASESVLARRPGTPADGPPGLTGWIRLESGAPSDSGALRLTDSDGRSLEGTWRRLAADSIAVLAFDDFLRVEMRLATADPMTGSARATSDAALVRDSTGKMSGFRRDWAVSAQRASCANMPAPIRR